MASIRTHRKQKENSIGILLTNIGSPDAATPSALRKYLKEFLSDRRIIDWPRWLWLPILHGIVLNVRPKRSAVLYQNIWNDGSPLINTMKVQARLLENILAEQGHTNLVFEVGMRYGNPSIAQGMREFREKGVEKILVFPLFPQYSSTTTASTFDAIFDELKSWIWMPEVHLAGNYHDHPAYVQALTNSILEMWDLHGKPEKLIFSFHGVPKRYIEESDDPYLDQCWKTVDLVANLLDIPDSDWQVSFQSRFGPEDWIQPYTDETLEKLGQEKLGSVQVLCPGFSADCLETLDEINREVREIYEKAGGKKFQYIPALNNRTEHIEALGEIIDQHLKSWQAPTITINTLNQPDKVPVS